ncbi:MAG: hypothetical protein NTW59_00490 [Candidatus Diapherotrites archaeon]|nr:hypothetical protein [Candidatus Diapherotrites archaeon]
MGGAGKPAFHGVTKASLHNVGGGRKRGGRPSNSGVVRVYGENITLRPGQKIVYSGGRPIGVYDERQGRIIRRLGK